jgi:hypothetical protein
MEFKGANTSFIFHCNVTKIFDVANIDLLYKAILGCPALA